MVQMSTDEYSVVLEYSSTMVLEYPYVLLLDTSKCMLPYRKLREVQIDTLNIIQREFKLRVRSTEQW